ncbi:MAG: hypothetical protein O3B04_08345 [Chloroflexi bacterium]|nr:hypothetical protein [Chloroflexota bacterium]MDA1297989.1 hypothetical protein [Chloroflexota bacterium]
MSKFSERLANLGQVGPAKMGFGKSAAREKNPVMLVIGRGGGQASDASNADLVLRQAGSTENGDGEWGLIVDGPAALDADALVENGCQFLLITSEDAGAEALLADELAKGLPVTDGLPEHRVRAIEDGPFDFLLYRPESIEWPLTVGAVLRLQDLVSCFSKHIFLDLPENAGLPGEKDLEVLRNLPVSALVIDLAAVNPADASKMKEAIAALEPRKPSQKGERSPLVLSGSRTTSDGHDHEDDDGYDGGDDADWEDEF